MEKCGEAAFASQCIPISEDLLTKDRYKDFVAARRVAIATRLNEFLGVSASAQT
jgi:hypothetical protein